MNEKTINRVVRFGAAAILFVALLMMFVINPHQNQDKFSSDNLWEAVHPFHWFWDSLALVGLVGFALYVGGFLGKVVYNFTGQRTKNSSGMVHVVGILCALLMLLFFA